MNYRPPRDRKQLNIIEKAPVTIRTVVGVGFQLILIAAAIRLFMLMASFPVVHIPVIDQRLQMFLYQTKELIGSWEMDRVFRE